MKRRPNTRFEKLNTRFEKLKDREWLYRKYWEEEYSMADIGEMLGCRATRVYEALGYHDIPARSLASRTKRNKDKTSRTLKGTTFTKERRRRISEANKRAYREGRKAPWNKGKRMPSETVHKFLTYRPPNKEEQFLIDFFAKYNLPYKFVGDGKVIIENRCPDFINSNGDKKVIEFFGEHWHRKEDEEEKRKIYERYGFKMLGIWGEDTKDTNHLLEKVMAFETGISYRGDRL